MRKLLASFGVAAILLLGPVYIQETFSQSDPTFRILAPKFICENSQSEVLHANTTATSIPSNHQITIGLQTTGGQRLRYRVTIHYTLLNGFVSQRHTLLLWRSIRQLERRLESSHEQISESNQIAIANNDLVPKVIYTFKIVGEDEAGILSQSQNFNVTYRGKHTGTAVDQNGSSASNDISLILLGSEVTYPDVPYLVTAKVIFCEARNDYKLNWTVSELVVSQSNLLEIPTGVLQPYTDYSITATVFSSEQDGGQLAKAGIKLTVLNRAPRLVLYPINSTAVFAQPVLIEVGFNKAAGTDISWSCEDSTGDRSCSDDLIASTNSVAVSFLKDDSYKLTASTSNISFSSYITVSGKSTISVTLQKLPPTYLVPGQQYEFVADVRGLVPKCACNWTVRKETGYAYFDPSSVQSLGGIFINGIDENFLSELVDYGNDTIEREVRLTIPASAISSNQTLLEPDVSYKMSLVTNCPEPINDSFNTGNPRKMVTSYWDMILETNGPPKGMLLVITPLENGTALETMFTLSVGVARDIETDHPLRYSYWYETAENSINIANYYEVMSTETQLPFSSEKISTYYIVCDSRAACSRVSGPSVSVQFNPFLEQRKLQFMVDSVRHSFNRANYYEACKVAFETLLTLKNQQSGFYDLIFEQIRTTLEVEIPKIQTAFLKQSPPITEENVLQIAQQVKVLIDLKHGSNDHLLSQLLELIDHVEKTSIRKIRSPEPKPITNGIDTSTTKIKLYESLIDSPNGTTQSKNIAKAQLLSYIPEVAHRHCDNQQTGYSDDWFTLETVRLKPTLRNALRGSIRIPHNAQLPQRATISGIEAAALDLQGDSLSYLCLGTVAFHKDLLSAIDPSPEQTHFQLFLTVVDKNNLGVLAVWPEGHYSWNITIMTTANSAKQYRCQLWFDLTTWTDEFCESSFKPTYLICNCTRLSYLRVITADSTETTTDTDMLTFSSLSTISAVETPFGLAATSIPVVERPQTTMLATNSTVDEVINLETNKTSRTRISTAANPLGYSIVAALALCALLTVTAIILYKRRRRTTTLTEELQGMAARVRSQSLPVRYARFQDEHNMGGDNVSTISDTITI
ncbi:uncharacterized protein LOC129722966 [Wyeomyia smithii]|uniref:uncharacterized protein LOC129722966 n=1 Tax=Wyeomyia smithii TaxID=174621 RepID=UPI002467B85B|nr:uncharacterized protein LOC129722966 [Wyeomyia smithii]